MQVFVPYKEPLMVAKCLDARRLNKQIIEAKQILNAINGITNAWFNHPIVKMYKDYSDWLFWYTRCLSDYKNSLSCEQFDMIANIFLLASDNNRCKDLTPPFLTDEFCDQHKRRLYTKDPVFYKDFAQYGTSEENWYVIDNKLVKYINGKRIN